MSILEDEAAKVTVSEDQLTQLASLARQQVTLEQKVAEATQRLADAAKELRDVQEKAIPELMLACGIETFVTTDGLKISVKETLTASIAKARRREAAQWLIDHGQGTLVKEDVVVHFDAGDSDRIKALQELLESGGYPEWSVDDAMNTGSVKAVIKEMLADGIDVPLKLFGAYFVRKATIKQQ